MTLGVAPLILAGVGTPASIIGLFTSDPAVTAAGVGVLPLMAVAVGPMLASMALAGILRGAGDTRSVMWASVIADYALYVPVAWLLAIPAGLGLTGVYLAFAGYWLARLGITVLRYRQGGWRLGIARPT